MYSKQNCTSNLVTRLNLEHALQAQRRAATHWRRRLRGWLGQRVPMKIITFSCGFSHKHESYAPSVRRLYAYKDCSGPKCVVQAVKYLSAAAPCCELRKAQAELDDVDGVSCVTCPLRCRCAGIFEGEDRCDGLRLQVFIRFSSLLFANIDNF